MPFWVNMSLPMCIHKCVGKGQHYEQYLLLTSKYARRLWEVPNNDGQSRQSYDKPCKWSSSSMVPLALTCPTVKAPMTYPRNISVPTFEPKDQTNGLEAADQKDDICGLVRLSDAAGD